MDLYFICYRQTFRTFVTLLKIHLWQVLQLEELHLCFNAQSTVHMDGEKSAELSPVPHPWQTAAQPPRPLSWPDTLMYGTDTSGPETSLKPAETLLLKKAKKGKQLRKKDL